MTTTAFVTAQEAKRGRTAPRPPRFFELKSDGEAIRYSARERKLFSLIQIMSIESPIDGVDSIELSKVLFKDFEPEDAPTNGLIIVGNLIRAMKAKMKANKEPFVIKSTRRAGPHPKRHKIIRVK